MEEFWDSLRDDWQEDAGQELVNLESCQLFPALQRLSPGQDRLEEDPESVFNRSSELREGQSEAELSRGAVEEELKRHGLESWTRGRAGYLVSGEMTEEACSADHVKEEDRMDSRLPLAGLSHTSYLDRARAQELCFFNSRQLDTLLVFLNSTGDFLRIQALYGLNEWMVTGNLKPFEAHPDVMRLLASVIFKTNTLAVKRMTAKILAGLAKNHFLRSQFLTEEGKEIIFQFLAILTKQERSCQGELTRSYIANFFANATENDLNFTSFILKNFPLDQLFFTVDNSSYWYLKLNILKFIKNILLHPLGFEMLIEVGDLDLRLLVDALLSLVPEFHQISFEILNILLRVSRNPWQDRMHTLFIEVNGVYSLASLLEETCFIDTKAALNAMLLMNHLADGKKAMHVLIFTVINLLKSILYHNNKNRYISFERKPRKQESLLPNTVNSTIKESIEIDKYNAMNSVPLSSFDLKLNYEFLEDSEMKVKRNTKPTAHASEKRVFQNSNKGVNFDMKDSSVLSMCEKRIDWRQNHEWSYPYQSPQITEFAKKCIETPFGEAQVKIDICLKIMSMEILAKLSQHEHGSRLLRDLIRCLSPVLSRCRENPGVCESVGFCLQQLIENTSAHLEDLLPQYYLLRELVSSLWVPTDSARASVLGALAALLKNSQTSVYNLPNFRIRAPLHYWLPMTPEEAPPDASLYNLVVLHCASRIYNRRDYVMSKTVVNNLFRIIQDSKTEEICKIYAICSLAFLTFANKRYRKLTSLTEYEKKDFTSQNFSGLSYETSEDVSEYDDSGPYPTKNSFSSIELDERLFLQIESRETRSPVTFFILFLLNLLMERSPSFWSPFIFKHYYTLMKWLKNCLEQKIAMAQELYDTIMHNIPTLSFYNNDIVHPWSRIDQEEFIVCVEKGIDKNSFPMLLSRRDEMSSIYYRYILSKDEVISPTPWDVYWKDCYGSEVYSSPQPCSSVLGDSLFGLGGIFTDRPDGEMAIQVYSKEMKDSKPQITEKYFLYYPESLPLTKICKLTSTFQRSRNPKTYANKYFTNHEETDSPKPCILPTLYRYMKQLLQNIPLCKSRKYEKPLYSIEKGFTIKKKRKDNYEKMCLLKLKEFYKPRIKMFSKDQFKLFVKAIKQPPVLWTKFCEENISANSPQLQKQLNNLRLLLKPFPNKLLKDVCLPTFDREVKLNIPNIKLSPYEEAANIVSTLILDSYESLCDKTFDTRKPDPIRINKKMPDELVWMDDVRMPEHLSKFLWTPQLSTGGKLFISALERPLGAKACRLLMQYRLPPDPRRGSITSSLHRRSRRSSVSLASVFRYPITSDGPSRLPDLSGSDSERHSTVISSTPRTRPDKDGETKKKKTSLSSPQTGRVFSAVTRRDLYLPTFTEVIIDLFFQSLNAELRKFRYLSRSDSLFTSADKYSDSKTSIDVRAARYILETSMLSLRRKIDYDSATCISRFAQDDTSSQEGVTRPERNPNFAEYCDFVKTGVQNILLNKDVRCWYSDIIKFIARSVCLRLEGPFGYVDEYIMRHHRQELKQLLGTTLIPFGRLRIGGPLEKAILFKFFADHFMIPCGLQRESMSRAWVEVPSHPFLYPLRGTCIVNLENSPGKLINWNSPEADEYKGYNVKPKANILTVENKEDVIGFDLKDSFEEVILDVKAKELSIIKKMKATIMNYDETDILNDSETLESFESSVKLQESSVSDEPECSHIISQEHFKQQDFYEFSETEEEEVFLPLQAVPKEDTFDNAEAKHISFLNVATNEEFVKFSWRDDPDGRYSMVLGKIPNNAFYGGSYSVFQAKEAPLHSNVESISEWQYKNADNLFPGISYVITTTENMMNELECGFRSKPPSEVQKIAQTQYTKHEFETKEYFKEWENILDKFCPISKRIQS